MPREARQRWLLRPYSISKEICIPAVTVISTRGRVGIESSPDDGVATDTSEFDKVLPRIGPSIPETKATTYPRSSR
jgi:hypothetical protein